MERNERHALGLASLYQGIIAESVVGSDSTHMNTTTNNNSLAHLIRAFSFAALLTSYAVASPSLEPRRIFDAEKERFMPNPDYHEPAAVKQTAQSVRTVGEPRRIFDAESGNFVANPAYHEPAPMVQVPRRGEPRRIFDAEKGRFMPNPDYHDSVAVIQVALTVAPARKPVVSRRATPSEAGAAFRLANTERK